MAALVTALAAGRPGSPVPESVEEIAAYLLDRERMGWRRLYGSRLAGEEFDTPPTVMARAVFTAVLAGPASYAEGVGRLDGLGLRAADRVVTDHRFCYPPLDRAQVLEPLRPDRLAEDLVALLIPGHDVSGYDPDPWTASVPRTLLAADRPDLPVPAFANRAVTVLASAADRWPHVGAELGSLIRQRPEIAVGAGSAALVALSHARYVDTDVLLEVEMRLPQQRQADLDVGAAAVTERLVRERVDDTTRLQDAASWYARLGVRLAHAGRKDEAVRANHQALAALHRLDELVPQTYGTHVALCLMDIGGYQSDLGRHKEAVGFTRRAIDLLREQVREGHREARPQLALALANYGNQLQNTGQRGDAVEAAGESVARYRELAGSDLADPPRLAFALCGLGTRLLAVGRNEDAAEALVESVAGYRELVAAAPQTHLPGLARALTNLGTARQRLGQRGEAVRAAEESVRIRRDLVELNGQAHTADLATSLLNYAGRLADVDEDEEAVARAEEAVKLARRLWRTDRLAHEALLANALASQGAVSRAPPGAARRRLCVRPSPSTNGWSSSMTDTGPRCTRPGTTSGSWRRTTDRTAPRRPRRNRTTRPCTPTTRVSVSPGPEAASRRASATGARPKQGCPRPCSTSGTCAGRTGTRPTRSSGGPGQSPPAAWRAASTWASCTGSRATGTWHATGSAGVPRPVRRTP